MTVASQWTFGRKIGLGFAITVALAILIAVVSTLAIRRVVESKDRVIDVNAQLLADAQELDTAMERKSAAGRAFLLTRDEKFVAQTKEARDAFAGTLSDLKRSAYSEVGQQLLGAIERAEADHQRAVDQVIALRRTDAAVEAVARAFDEQVGPTRQELNRNVKDFLVHEEKLLKDAEQASTSTASAASMSILGIAGVAAILAAAVALVLTRTLSRQIGTAVSQVQSSSSELQAAASQQATGAKEHATAMSEITTTISELLATSRQIAESAQRVASVAEQTAGGARAGGGTVQKSTESIAGIRRQMDLVVSHMLELGKKSQQAGGVLDIVSELAEQTNILAINATIEAAGAGESGKRFAVVADEIRKLSDRVTGSTKEIRGLIEDVRSAVNTTVMATETGSKAVDAGTRQFEEVASSFKRIADLVSTTTAAAREIELSTKQQTTAVEQVNIAIANVAQATKEAEVGSGQTLETASQLASLSKDLLRLVQPPASA